MLVMLAIVFLNMAIIYMFRTSHSDKIVVPLKHATVQSIRGSQAVSSRLVVFSHVPAGFGNNMMCLLSSYAVAIALDAPLACMSLSTVTSSRTRLSIQ